MRVMTRIAVLFVLGLAATAGATPKRSHPSPQIVRAHRVARLGVAAIEISPQLREHFGAPREQGVLVDVVQDDSTAARAGVLVGDVVIEVDGEPIGSPRAIRDAMRGREEGDDLVIAVIRDSKRFDLHAPVTAPDEALPDEDLERMMDRARELLRRHWQAQPEGERI
jgi:membrane-associated protease RseP (regulator of RpoE activity)